MSDENKLADHVDWFDRVPSSIGKSILEVQTFFGKETSREWAYMGIESRGYSQKKVARLEALLREARSTLTSYPIRQIEEIMGVIHKIDAEIGDNK